MGGRDEAGDSATTEHLRSIAKYVEDIKEKLFSLLCNFVADDCNRDTPLTDVAFIWQYAQYRPKSTYYQPVYHSITAVIVSVPVLIPRQVRVIEEFQHHIM